MDVVMWTKDPDDLQLFKMVLRSIDAAVPEACHRHIVDASRPATRDQMEWISSQYGWKVHAAERPGIPFQANQALRLVDSDRFASFEQDVIVNPEWLDHTTHMLDGDPLAAVAQGIRLFVGSPTLEAIDRYKFEKKKMNRWFYSLDNDLWRTDIVRSVGGFPTECPIAMDGMMRERLILAGYHWLTTKGCVSLHIRERFLDDVRTHIRRIAFQKVFFELYIMARPYHAVTSLILGPLTGARVAVSTHSPSAFLAMPLEKYAKAISMLVSTRRKTIRGKLPLYAWDRF